MADLIRILIVDDHPVVRTGIQGMLAHHNEFQVVGEAGDGAAAIQLTIERKPDVVLMDLRMPNMDGLEAMRHIRQQCPQTQVLILTTYDTDKDILSAVQSGAVGYLLKDAPREDLYRAIRAASRGESVLPPHIAARLMAHMRNPEPQALLSEREVSVLELVSEGFTNKQIAKTLHISEATVKTHLIHIFSKLGVPDRASAVRAAIERGILTLGNA